MIALIRYCRGYVRISVRGYAPERFMNLCANRAIVLWELNGHDGFYTMCISLSDFFKIRDIVHKTKTRVAVLEKRGLPFFLQDVRHRKMFLLGVFLCSAFLILMSQFIWAMEFDGNRMITEEELKRYLEDEGIRYGTPRHFFSAETLEKGLREAFEEITWASVSLQGTKLVVKIQEDILPDTAQKQELSKFENGADLVASCSGTVVSILTRSGIPTVRPGDSVSRGDLLISGRIPVKNDDETVREYLSVVADGDVILETDYRVHLSCPYAYQYKNYTGREKNRKFLTIGSLRILFPPIRKNFVRQDIVTQQNRLCLFGQLDLPIFAGSQTLREYLPVDARYDTDSAKKILLDKFQKIIAALEEKGVQIIQKDVRIVEKADILTLEGSLKIQLQGGVWQALSISDTVKEQETAQN